LRPIGGCDSEAKLRRLVIDEAIRMRGWCSPALRGKRAGETKGKVSHALALRRDLRRSRDVERRAPSLRGGPSAEAAEVG